MHNATGRSASARASTRARPAQDSSFFTYFLMLHFKSSIMPQVESTSFYPIVPFNRRGRRFELLSVNSTNGPFPDTGIYFVPAKRCFPTTKISMENRTINRVASALRVFVISHVIARSRRCVSNGRSDCTSHSRTRRSRSRAPVEGRDTLFRLCLPSRRPCPLRFQSAIN